MRIGISLQSKHRRLAFSKQKKRRPLKKIWPTLRRRRNPRFSNWCFFISQYFFLAGRIIWKISTKTLSLRTTDLPSSSVSVAMLVAALNESVEPENRLCAEEKKHRVITRSPIVKPWHLVDFEGFHIGEINASIRRVDAFESLLNSLRLDFEEYKHPPKGEKCTICAKNFFKKNFGVSWLQCTACGFFRCNTCQKMKCFCREKAVRLTDLEASNSQVHRFARNAMHAVSYLLRVDSVSIFCSF